MNDQSNSNDAFVDAQLVAVIGGTIDCAGNLREDIKICKVVQVGESDILVTEASSYMQERSVVVPKALCVPLSASFDQVASSKTLVPELEDLVLYHGKLDWKDKKASQVTGILCEIKYQYGVPHKAKLLFGGQMQEVPFGDLLVLQRKKSN